MHTAYNKLSRQGYNAGSGRENRGQNHHALLSSLLLSLRTAFHTLLCTAAAGQSARLYLNSPLPYIPLLLRGGRNACVWYGASACVSVIIVCRANAPPTSIDISHAHTHTHACTHMHTHCSPHSPQYKLVAYPQGRPIEQGPVCEIK